MRVEGQQRKPDGINNETFIKSGGAGGDVAYSMLHGQTANAAIVVCGTESPHHPACFYRVKSNLFLVGTLQRHPTPTSPQEPSLHCFAFLSVFITTFFSFMLPMFSLLTAWLDKCVYGIFRVYKISTQATVYNK